MNSKSIKNRKEYINTKEKEEERERERTKNTNMGTSDWGLTVIFSYIFTNVIIQI